MKRSLAVGWAVLVAGLAVAYSQGCFRETAEDRTPSVEEAPSMGKGSRSPVLMPASKADAGAGARRKRQEGQAGRKAAPGETDAPNAQQPAW